MCILPGQHSSSSMASHPFASGVMQLFPSPLQSVPFLWIPLLTLFLAKVTANTMKTPKRYSDIPPTSIASWATSLGQKLL